MNKLIELFKANRFNTISWGITALLVAALLGSTLWWTQAGSASPAMQLEPTARPNQNSPVINLPVPTTSSVTSLTIQRQLQLKTVIPAGAPRLDPITYTTQQGDSLSIIAKNFNIKMESIIYSSSIKNDNPEGLTPGIKLTIPPVDGIVYTWKDGDTIQEVADKFKAKADDILNFPGNDIDLTNPQIKPGTVMTIPGGKRDLINWTATLPTIGRVNNGSTGTSDFGNASCPTGGATNISFGFPTDAHFISGNDFSPSHQGIDLAANDGANIYAAAAGVVTMAQTGDNYGYGTVIQICHAGGYVTLYAHLSQLNVSVGQPVGQGTIIGYAGHTGNAFGAHLHFEIRLGGENLDPKDFGL